MESFQCVGQFINRQVTGKGVEHPQGITDFPGMSGILDGIKGLGPVYKTERPPEGPLRVDPKILPVLGHQNPGHLPSAVGV